MKNLSKNTFKRYEMFYDAVQLFFSMDNNNHKIDFCTTVNFIVYHVI